MLKHIARSLFISIGLLHGLFFSFGAHALSSEIKIAINEIPEILEADKAYLPYNKVLLTLNERVTEQISLHFHPASRAAADFNNNKTNCLFPGSTASDLFSNESNIESKPINVAKAYFIGKDITSTSRILDDNGPRLTIGYRRGNTFGTTIERLRHHRLFPLNSDKQAVDMLRKGRIDLVLAYMPDSIALLEEQKGVRLKYSDESLFYIQGDNILCHDKQMNRDFINAVNIELEKMKMNGELKALLGNAYVE